MPVSSRHFTDRFGSRLAMVVAAIVATFFIVVAVDHMDGMSFASAVWTLVGTSVAVAAMKLFSDR